MEFYANRYTLRTEATITGTSVPSKNYTEGDYLLPRYVELALPASAYVDKSCGHNGTGYAEGRVSFYWMQNEWSIKGASDTKHASQPLCTQTTPGEQQYALYICTTTTYYSGNAEYMGESKSCEWHSGNAS